MDKIIYLTPNKIIERYNPRVNGKEITELKASIKKHGILVPLLIQPSYGLISGYRRRTCALDLKLKEIPCIIKNISDEEADSMAYEENQQGRVNLNPIEEAQHFQHMKEKWEWTQEKIAKEYAMTEAVISYKLSLLKLDNKILSQLKKGKISETHCWTISRLPIRLETVGGEIRNFQLEALERITEGNRIATVEVSEKIVKQLLKEVKFEEALKKESFVKTMKEHAKSIRGLRIKMEDNVKDMDTLSIQLEGLEKVPLPDEILKEVREDYEDTFASFNKIYTDFAKIFENLTPRILTFLDRLKKIKEVKR